MPAAPVIEFQNVQYQIAGKSILSDLTLTLDAGHTTVLLGRSGSGKTTSLKLINRLVDPTTGTVCVEGKSTADWDVIRLRRHIGYAIQGVGLFPHYTVKQNVAAVPKLEHWDAKRIGARVEELLQIVGLPAHEFGSRYPSQLSGGQIQRVGIARALAADPPILLMDEPFGALDQITRTEIQQEFRQLQQRLQKTVVFVTHDVGEALFLGDRIAVMDSGRLHGVYTPREFVSSSDSIVKSYIDSFRVRQQALNPN